MVQIAVMGGRVSGKNIATFYDKDPINKQLWRQTSEGSQQHLSHQVRHKMWQMCVLKCALCSSGGRTYTIFFWRPFFPQRTALLIQWWTKKNLWVCIITSVILWVIQKLFFKTTQHPFNFQRILHEFVSARSAVKFTPSSHTRTLYSLFLSLTTTRSSCFST